MANHKELNFINKVLFLGLLALFFHNASGQETNEGEPGSGNSDEDHQQLYLDVFLNKPNEADRNITSDRRSLVRLEKDLVWLRNLSKTCSRGQFYYSFNPECQQDVCTLESLLLSEKNTVDLLNLAKVLRDDPQVHPKTWYTALSRVALERDDLRGLWKPPPASLFPRDYFDNRAIAEAISPTPKERAEQECIVVDERFADDNVDRDLWYFREDIQMNSHHWFWHVTYPSSGNRVHADRRGELFYYIHHSKIARYNAERISNGLPIVSPIVLSRDYIMNDPYYPHLDSTNSRFNWSSRDRPTRLPDFIETRQGRTYLNRTIQGFNRLNGAIDNGYLETIRGRIALRPVDGIDILADTTEASEYTANRDYYASVHNSGHNLISKAHDPTNPNAFPGVMGDQTTSMRDFIFYPFHLLIDNIFEKHKKLLSPYQPTTNDHQLGWSNVVIESISVNNKNNGPINTLRTYWSYKKFNLSSGLDFSEDLPKPALLLCVKHLDHEDFIYDMLIRATSPQVATIRIFLAPTTDAKGRPFSMEEQRAHFFVLDTFNATLTSGSNLIKRDSRNSTLTIPWGEGLYNLDQENKRAYCGCGWPYHLLLPKGTTSGMSFDLFVMATNAKEDGAAYETQDPGSSSFCHAAPLYCGLPKQKYPDLKPMGYPFDRIPYSVNGQPLANINEYVRYVPNTSVTKITIRHVNDIVS